MRRSRIPLAAAAAVFAATVLHAQTFRTGVNVVRVDVSVIDRNGAPVAGLTKDDFEILEDGKAAPIVAFEAVNIPPAPPPPPGQAAWVTENRRDVISNRVEERRVVMIVIDDATLPFSVNMQNTAIKIGRDIVAGLSPSDRAAVIFTKNDAASQDFTSDKSLLNRAIDTTRGGNVLTAKESEFADAFYYKNAAKTLTNAVNLMKTLPQGRKAVVFISTGVPVQPEDIAARAINEYNSIVAHEAAVQLRRDVAAAMNDALIAQVAVYAFEPAGLGELADYATNYYRKTMSMTDAMRAGENYAKYSTDFLEAQASASGGLAFVRGNSHENGIRKMFSNLSTFYLIGFSSAASSSGIHKLSVQTKNPAFRVQSRTSFRIAPADKKAEKISSEAPAKGMGLTKAMNAALPEGNLPMRVAAAPFAGFADQHPVAIALGIHQPKAAGLPSTTVSLRVNAYSADGKYVTGKKLEATMKLRPTEADAFQYEMLSTLRLRPGRYQLRLGAEIDDTGLAGSVFADVDVPDFVKDPISMSGLALTMTPKTTAAPVDAFKDIAPVFTSHRAFDAGNTVSVLAKVYQGGRSALVDVAVSARVMDVRDRAVYSRKETLAAGQFKLRTADYEVEIPVATLDPGEYLLIIEAALPNGKVARRDLRFSRR